MARGSRYNIVKDKIHVKEMQKHQDTLSENVFQ